MNQEVRARVPPEWIITDNPSLDLIKIRENSSY